MQLIVISVSKVKGQRAYIARSHNCKKTAERPTRSEAVNALKELLK